METPKTVDFLLAEWKEEKRQMDKLYDAVDRLERQIAPLIQLQSNLEATHRDITKKNQRINALEEMLKEHNVNPWERC